MSTTVRPVTQTALVAVNSASMKPAPPGPAFEIGSISNAVPTATAPPKPVTTACAGCSLNLAMRRCRRAALDLGRNLLTGALYRSRRSCSLRRPMMSVTVPTCGSREDRPRRRMRSVRMRPAPRAQVLHRFCARRRHPRHSSRAACAPRASRDPTGVLVLDVIYLVATVALFALVGLIAKGVEKL